MPASMNIHGAKGKDANSAITKHRFVKLDTTDQSGAGVVACNTQGEDAYGVSLFGVSGAEALRGKGASVITEGRAIVEAGATVNVGDAVMTDSVGRAILATSTNFVLGTCDENGGGGAGTQISVMLSLAGNKA